MPFASTEGRRAWSRAYREKNKEKVDAIKRAWVERNQEKRAAHMAVHKALLRGDLERGPCEQASDDCTPNGRIEAHHEDYSQPLVVRWLCPFHHKQVHKCRS